MDVVSCQFLNNSDMMVTNVNHKNTETDIIFDHLTEKNEPGDENVTDMLREKDGILWFNTSFVFYRYDRQKIELFNRL